MDSIKVILRTSNNSGEGTLFFRIIHRRKMRQLHAGCKIRQEEWAAAEGKVVISGDDSRKAYLKSVQDKQSTGLARLSLIVGNLPQTENRPEAFNQVGATDAGDCQHTQ